MPRVRRPRLSVNQKAELWSRWKRGESLSEIARALDRVPGAIFQVVVQHGGIPPPERRRSNRVLSAPEREEISRALAAGATVRGIARTLRRAPSTVSREIQRNGGAASVSSGRGRCASLADGAATEGVSAGHASDAMPGGRGEAGRRLVT